MKRVLLTTALIVLAGCQPKAPLLQLPDRIDSFCTEKEPRGSAIESILSSVDGRLQRVPLPTDAALRASLKKGTGVIGYWKSQPLYLPAATKALGLPGDYLDVTSVAINNVLDGADSRLVYVTIATAQGPKRLVLRAYDTQNACVEGERLS